MIIKDKKRIFKMDKKEKYFITRVFIMIITLMILLFTSITIGFYLFILKESILMGVVYFIGMFGLLFYWFFKIVKRKYAK